MTAIEQAPVGPDTRAAAAAAKDRLAFWRRPALLFAGLSILFGTLTIMVNPPLRGPDEDAHFVRIHAYATGTILPDTELAGRKGIYLPAHLFRDFAVFEANRRRVWQPGFT